MDGAGIAIPARLARVIAPGRVEIVETDPPRPGPGMVRVRLEGSGVCASNLEPWAGPDWMTFPLDPGGLGHEGWGRIDAVGDGVDDARMGERVAVFGDHSFATHEIVPTDAALTVPDALAGQPVPAEPVACALSIFRLARVRRGDRVAIIGAGFLGLLLTRLAKQAGAEVIALSRRAESLARARDWGAARTMALDDDPAARVMEATGGKGCDICIECTGHQSPLDLAGAITRESGRIVIAGFHQDGPRQIDMQHWNWRAFEIVNAHVRDRATILATMREALDVMASRALDVRPLLTHRYPLHRLGEALDATRDKPEGFVKAWIDMPADAPRPRLGFLGLGWIGVNRMEALARSGLCEVAMLADSDCCALDAVAHAEPEAARGRTLDDVLAERPDGVVIATPSALHARQAIEALEAGAAVFCQKPLGRTEAETRAVVEAARRADRLLAVDLSYRRTSAMQAVAREVRSGALGQVFHVDLTFHNAYGPDKPWFHDAEQSGGGCLMDSRCPPRRSRQLASRGARHGVPTRPPSVRWCAAAARRDGGRGFRPCHTRDRLGHQRPPRLFVEPAGGLRRPHRRRVARHGRRGTVPQCRRVVLRFRGAPAGGMPRRTARLAARRLGRAHRLRLAGTACGRSRLRSGLQ